MSTIAQHLDQAANALSGTSNSPRLDAEVLLSHILGQDRAALLAHEDQQLETSAAQQLSTFILQRTHHVPVPYLTGYQAFFGMSLEVTPDVLVPRPATELLVEAVLKRLPADTTMTVADVGTGCGAIALALAAHLPQATIIASDISLAALAVAKKNAERMALVKRITFIRSFLLSDYNLKPDFIIANLPYLRPDQLTEPTIQCEPRLALDGGLEGLELVDQLLDQVAAHPTISGLAVELDPQQMHVVSQRLKSLWPGNETTEITDGQSIRGILCRNKKSGETPSSGINPKT